MSHTTPPLGATSPRRADALNQVPGPTESPKRQTKVKRDTKSKARQV